MADANTTGSLDEFRRYVASRSANELIGCAAPVVCSFARREGDATSVFASVRRGTDSFCFVRVATTVIGTEPTRVLRLRGVDQAVSGSLLEETTQGNVVDELKLLVGAFRVPSELRHEVAACNGAAFGFVGFDAIRTFEPSVRKGDPPADNLQMPESVIFVCTSLVVLTEEVVHIVALCPLHPSGLEVSYGLALARIADLRARVDAALPPVVPDYPGAATGGKGVSNAGHDGYCSHVRFLKSRIRAGDMVQTVPSHRVLVETPCHPFNVWRAMRRNASRYSYYVECRGGLTIVGASPELLVSVTGGGECETHPIAGTRRRGRDAAEDEKLKANLLADAKELAEHVMLVDLGRNDLSRVCEDVTVPRLMQVDYFSHVMHIVSCVTGKLRPGRTPFDAFQSVFPAGTVSGAPKLMAVQHIYTLEKERRGLYAGALGYFDLSGQSADFCIAIRTLLWTGPRRCYAQAGGGIVLDSEEEAEYQETLDKMGGVLAAVRAAEEKLEQQPRAERGWMCLPPSDASEEHNQLFETAVAAQPSRAVSAKKELAKGCVLLVDNYDSFTFNLYQLLSKNHSVNVVRNDEYSVEECVASQPSHIVLGPGPCSPGQAGICAPLIRACEGKIPILGVCLGMEVMVEVYGGLIDVCGEIKHGKTSSLLHDGRGAFAGVTQGVAVTRYHSLAAFAEDLKAKAPLLTVTSVAEDSNVIMGVRHVTHCIEGLQFHPESIATEQGAQMIDNFLSWNSGSWGAGPPGSILQRIVATIPQSGPSVATDFQFPTISLLERVLAEQPHTAVIAEIKRASPSMGDIASAPVDAGKLATRYSSCPGVCGVSVLTEPHFFKGSLADLTAARRAVEAEAIESGRPRCAVLRKDFVVHEYQLLEARAAGADAVLLIVAILSELQLSTLLAASRNLGMEPLVEAANELELRRALRVGARLIGVNARDLHSFSVSVDRASELIALGKKEACAEVAFVALSGVSGRDHVVSYRNSGAAAVLVGEHLMRAPSVPRALALLQGKALPPLVKVCGICSAEDAKVAVEAGADIVGLIFAPQSKRVLTVDQAKEIIAAVRSNPAPLLPTIEERANAERPLICGVFSGQTGEQVAAIHAALRLDVLQFHGAEGVVFRPTDGALVIRVVSVAAGNEPVVVPEGSDLLLFDSAGGGTGQSFDWSRVPKAVLRKSFLAGGLNPRNVSQAVARAAPLGVDACSGLEKAVRVKDAALVEQYVRRSHRAALRNRGVKAVLQALVHPEQEPPSATEVSCCLEAMLLGSATHAQIGAFLAALALRRDVGEDAAVLLQCRALMMSHALPFASRAADSIVIDIVGTGGDGLDTFNASTAASLVVASLVGEGQKILIAKHGNRSASGKCGAADFFEALGGSLTAESARASAASNFSFLFAPAFHPALAAVRALRREIGVRTVFNLLGPLMSPAAPSHLVLGVASTSLGAVYASLLASTPGVLSALVVCGAGGLDEVSPEGATEYWRVDGGRVSHHGTFSLADFGLSHPHSLASVASGPTAAANAAIWREMIAGKSEAQSARVDFVSVNAAAALWVAGMAPSLAAGTTMAQDAIRSGRVQQWMASNKL